MKMTRDVEGGPLRVIPGAWHVTGGDVGTSVQGSHDNVD
jgi:hypothetical protein